MNKKLAGAISSVLLAAALSGCFPKTDTGKGSVGGSDDLSNQVGQNAGVINGGEGDGQVIQGTPPDPSDFPSSIRDDSVPNVDVRASIHMPEGVSYLSAISTSDAVLHVWNQDEILTSIANGRPVKSDETFENSGPDDLARMCVLEDDSDIVFYTDSVNYYTPQEKEVDYASYFDSFGMYTAPESLDKEFGNADIEGLSKEDAIQSAEEILDVLQIRDRVGDPKIVSMDHDSINTLIELEQTIDRNGEPVSMRTEEDDAYALIYPVLYQGLVSQGFWGSGENSILSSAKVYFVYGRTGLVAFHISGICDITSQGQLSYIYAPTKIVKSIQDEYAEIISMETLCLNQLRLTYVLRQDAEGSTNAVMEPVWLVIGKKITTSEDEEKGTINSPLCMMFSATTGEQIPLDYFGV